MSIKGFQIGEGSVQKYDYTELDNKPTVPVVDATLTTTGAAADAKKTGDEIADLKSAITECTDAVTELDGQINGSIEPTVYTLPSGYQNANYSNAAGTNKFKYVDGKLELAKLGAAGSITSSTAGLTTDSTLMFNWAANQNSKVLIEYNNPNQANIATINFRFYDLDINNNTATLYELPTGVGSIEVSILDIVQAAAASVTAETKPYVMIRDISLLSGAESYSNVSANIIGFSTGGGLIEGLADKVEDLETGFALISTAENQYEVLYEDLGYPNATTGELASYDATKIEKTSKYIPATPGDVLHIQVWSQAGDLHGRIVYFDSSKGFVSYADIPSSNRITGYAYCDFTVPSGVSFFRFGYYSFGNGRAMITTSNIKTGWIPALVDCGTRMYNSADKYDLKGINHRGYNTVAPENTIPAFVLSAKNGFNIIETDVQFTSDNVPVLLHDPTINRTARNADGTELSSTIYINSITYAQTQEYDFGIWKGESYAGTKIPTFEEFLIICRKLGLHPYIEIKNEIQYTDEQMQLLFDIVKKYGMETKCTWISFALRYLVMVKKAVPCARIGYIVSTITNKRVIETQYLKTQYNEVFLDANVSNLTNETISLVKNQDIPLEVYSINTTSEMLQLDDYISGVTSDLYNFSTVIRENMIGV